MFTENIKSKSLEHSRIKNLNEFGLNLDECQTLFTKDSKYAVLYTEIFIAIMDLNKRTLISKHSNEKSAKISKLKLTHRNNITYINKYSNHTDIIVSSIDFLGDYFQLTVSDDIVDYIYVEGNEKEDSLFLISTRGDLYYYSQLELKKKTNIVADSGNMIKPWHFKEINKVEFVEETKSLLIFLSNGTVINYTVSPDPEKALDTSNNSSNKTICFEEVKHFECSAPSEAFIDDLRYNRDNYDITTFKILKFVFDFGTFVTHNEEMEVDSGSSKIKTQSVFICVGYTKNKTDSYLLIYEILGNQLVLINTIFLQSKVIVDSYFYVTNNDNLKTSVPDYFILCCRLLDVKKIQFLASDFLECLKKSDSKEKLEEGANELFSIVNEIPDNITITKNMSIIGVYITPNSDYLWTKSLKNNQSIFSKKMKKNIINNLESENFDAQSEQSVMTNINDLRNMNYSLKLIIRQLLNYNKADAYLLDFDIEQIPYTPSKKIYKSLLHEISEDMLLSTDEYMRPAITSDVLKHIDFFHKNNTPDLKQRFKEKVINVITTGEETSYRKFKEILEISKRDEKTDFYLLLLIYHNDLIPIKYYLSLKEGPNVNNKTFVLSNDKLFHTVNNVFYFCLKKTFHDKLKDQQTDFKFFSSEKVLTNLQTVLEILKISKNRNEMAYNQPFSAEKVMIKEGAITIQNVIFDLENVLTIFKIIKSYFTHILTGEDESYSMNQDMISNVQQRKQMRKNRVLFLELVTLSPFEDFFPNLKKFYLNYFNEQKLNSSKINQFNLQDSNSGNSYAYNEVLYFTKFQFFFYYFYYLMDFLKIKEDHKKINSLSQNNMLLCDKVFSGSSNIFSSRREFISQLRKKYFDELEEEFSEYFTISEIFYKLDYHLCIKENPDMQLSRIYSEIDITTISQFSIKLNKSEIYKTNYFKEILNRQNINFNSSLISFLSSEGYTKEALSLSNSILTLVNDLDDLRMQLSLLLEMNLINIAYQFVNNCFASLVCYSENFQNPTENTPINGEKAKSLLDIIINSEEFKKMRELYFYFFEFLIKHNHIPVVYSLPLNFIERHLLKEFFIQNRQYEEFLLIYYIKMKKIKDAENCLNAFRNNSAYDQNLKDLYSKMVECMKFLYGDNFYEIEEIKSLGKNNQDNTEKLSYEVNANVERENYKKLGVISEIRNINEMTRSMMQDSIMDIDFIAYKPSDTSVNETIKNILMKKQKTAKKTFGMFTDVKPKQKKAEAHLMSGGAANERNLTENSKYKSMIALPKFNIDTTPIRNEENSRRPLLFSSNMTLKNTSAEKNIMFFDYLTDSNKK